MSTLVPTEARYFLVLPAAGSGQRMGAARPKQYLEVNGLPVLQHTLQRLGGMPYFSSIVLVLSADDPYWPALAPKLDAALREKIQVIDGGAQRCDSVLNGLLSLQDIANDNDWVLVHDVVRPCVHPDDVRKLIENLRHEPCGGLLASPVRETLKRSDGAGMVQQTVDRSQLWCAATPQMFRYGVLLRSLQQTRASTTVTDEAEAVERCGHAVRLVPGRADNVKITFPEDLQLAALLLEATR
jgi:2-C-methyl-D-erythritol 4-phosphate cytidylyltransferase